ncbi:MAG: DUF4253 domain-containing protein [Chloroflexales bacterium]|nr:DUF4253 domain-containing protein [Chloroflexales bacterium]
MITTLDELSGFLRTHRIDAEDLQKLDIDASSAHAFALEIDSAHELDVWHTFHDLVHQTHYYPLLVEDWSNDRDFFLRSCYEHEQSVGLIPDVAPDAILAAVSHADIGSYLRQQESLRSEDLAEEIDWERERTREQFGACPTTEAIVSLVERQVIRSTVDLERWLFQWERQTFGDTQALGAIDTCYLDWFDTENVTSIMLLLPVLEGWNTLAYLHWYGAFNSGTPIAIQFLKQWRRDYGAELVCHYGTMLQFLVGRSPATPEAAFHLAWEQVALAECTTILPGVSIREHARALLMMDRWFLHERP